MYQLVNFSQPAETPVSATEAKDYLRIDNSLEDSRIATMIGSATRMLEEYLSIRFITQSVDIFMDRFPLSSRSLWFDGVREIPVSAVVTPERSVTLPLGNVTEITHFKTFDDSTEFTEDLSNYNLDIIGPRARVGLKLSGVWPQTILRSVNGINFRVKSGWATASAVPADIKQAVLELVAHMYENRGDQEEMKIPAHIMTIVAHRRREKLGL